MEQEGIAGVPSLLFSGPGFSSVTRPFKPGFSILAPRTTLVYLLQVYSRAQFCTSGHHRSVCPRFTGNIRRQSKPIEFILMNQCPNTA